jgi:MoaD family protein
LKLRVQAVGLGKIEFELTKGTTVEDLLDQLFEQYPDSLNNFLNPESGKIYSFVSIWINSSSIKQLQDIKTNLREGDVVTIFRPSAGG